VVSQTGPDEEAVLPSQTGDDTDVGWGDEPIEDDGRLLDERPPHHLERD
jgi:hypothetical protein